MAKKLSAAMSSALDIAIDTGMVCAGWNTINLPGGGIRRERVAATTVLALIARGLLLHCYTTDGGLAGRVHPTSIAGVNLAEKGTP
jgi:hypothetical protein